MVREKQKTHKFDEFDRSLKYLYDTKQTDRFFEKLDQYQRDALDAILGKTIDVVIFDEKSGCGKTTLAWLGALTMLREGRVSKIVYVRVPSERGLKHGFIPGDLDEKESLYMLPAYDTLQSFGIFPHNVDMLRQKGLIEFCTDSTLRGRNISDSFVIIDEPQNADLETLRLILTRIHDSCKVVLSGHSGQLDNNLKMYLHGIPFQVYTYHLLKKSWAKKFSLPINYRGRISRWADDISLTLSEGKD